MPHPIDLEEFSPHREAITAGEIATALADLNPSRNLLGLSIPLPYTRRPDGPHAGTVDTIEIGEYNPGSDWMVYTGRSYHGDGHVNITSVVARCSGHMVLLVVRGLYAYLTAAGTRGRTDTIESDVMYALGLVREPAPEPVAGIERPGVHAAHCCAKHGCKYGSYPSESCPVVTGLAAQEYPCEQCDDEAEEARQVDLQHPAAPDPWEPKGGYPKPDLF